MKKGFTIVELVITIGVIGVVAAITMSLVFRNTHGIEFGTASSKLQLQLKQTLETMNAAQTLTGYATTKDFIGEFSQNLKVIKTCPSNNLSGCFPETFKSGDTEFSLSDVKGSEFMGKDTWKSDVEGVILINGFKLLIAYNPKCSKKNPQNCASILYDLNSIEKDNIFAGNGVFDLGTFNAAFVGGSAAGADFIVLGDNYSFVDCRASNSDSPDFKYCDAYVGVPTDYSAGAKKACDEIGMKLPSFNEAVELIQHPEYHLDEFDSIYTTDSLHELGDPEGVTYWAVVAIPGMLDYHYYHYSNVHRDGQYDVVCIAK